MQMEEHQKKRPLLVNQVTGELWVCLSDVTLVLEKQHGMGLGLPKHPLVEPQVGSTLDPIYSQPICYKVSIVTFINCFDRLIVHNKYREGIRGGQEG